MGDVHTTGAGSGERRDLEASLAGAAAAHRRLLAAIGDGLTDDQACRASLLPGWSVGHVLTHLARNADGVVRMVDAACRGEVADQYDGGVEGRAAAIERGAGRAAAELVADVRGSIEALEHAWDSCTEVGWRGHGRGNVGEVPVADMPFRRWREVEVHHADLGLGFTPADWDAEYVRRELVRQQMAWKSRRPMGLTDLPETALALAPHERLAWLLGRAHIDGLADPGLMA